MNGHYLNCLIKKILVTNAVLASMMYKTIKEKCSDFYYLGEA